ncbi:MAG TPA: hypothetical protein VG917_00650 [Patescibacteria group bacterium]|nr:hypothetical protein [Patescibacteria group bacterium]
MIRLEAVGRSDLRDLDKEQKELVSKTQKFKKLLDNKLAEARSEKRPPRFSYLYSTYNQEGEYMAIVNLPDYRLIFIDIHRNTSGAEKDQSSVLAVGKEIRRFTNDQNGIWHEERVSPNDLSKIHTKLDYSYVYNPVGTNFWWGKTPDISGVTRAIDNNTEVIPTGAELVSS